MKPAIGWKQPEEFDILVASMVPDPPALGNQSESMQRPFRSSCDA